MSAPSSSGSSEKFVEKIFSSVARLAAHIFHSRSSFNHIAGMAVAGVFPFLARALWYYSRTVIEIVDDEQSMWIQTFMASECSDAVLRMRRLTLNSSSQKTGNSSNRRMGPQGAIATKYTGVQDDKEGGRGRFAPPKLSFRPGKGASLWTWYGCWPVSITDSELRKEDMTYHGNPRRHKGYFLSVWFAPNGMYVANELLLRGRQLYLAKRAEKTEIWIHSYDYGKRFKVLTRPSRPLSTVIIEGDIKESIREDATKFLASEKWYVDKGIPYRRGYLLHGPPGCGKTSLVTALAGELRLPIVLVSLGNKDVSDSELTNLLSDVPRDSIVLIEDVDCALTPIEENKQEEPAPVALPGMFGRKNMKLLRSEKTNITLSGLLNAIDGVGAQEGRILFMTTNHIENLDEALIRPGRVDAKFYIGKATRKGAQQLFDQFVVSSDNFSHQNLDLARVKFLEKVEDGIHSFATLQGVLMKARDDPAMIGEGMEELLRANIPWSKS